MTPASAVRHASRAGERIGKHWNTLDALRAGLWALLALDLLLLLACLAGARVHRDAIQTIGRDTAPGIIAAQRIKMALADMDIDSARKLLSPDPAATAPDGAYRGSGTAAANAFIDAAQSIRYGREQREPIEKIQQTLGSYDARIQRALDLHDEKNPAALDASRRAANLMDTVLLPAADALDGVSSRHLDEVDRAQSSYSIAARAGILLFGVLLLTGLVALQTYLADRTRRILNLPLLAATLAGVGFTIWSLTALGTGERDLKIARKDAFISIHALWKARAAARSAWDEEARFLLDRGKVAADDSAFERGANQLMLLPPGITIGQIAENGLNPHGPVSFTGYFADELNNITFPGERDAAVQTILNFGEFLRIDREIRRLESSGKSAEALALWNGRRPGEGTFAFQQFDDALNRTIAINQRVFDAAVADGFGSLSNFEAKASGAAALIALLAFAGLMQRIAEYR